MADSSIIEIDGSYLEGGGQILRISTALSVLLTKPIHVFDIRKGRSSGGLKAQHLTGITLLAQLSRAKLTNAAIKSTEIVFSPDRLTPGSYLADTKTAGSLTLLLQNAVPVLIFGSTCSELHLRGGTNVSFSPQIEEFQHVFMSTVRKHFGIELECEVARKGFYPRGGGELFVRVMPVTGGRLKPMVLEEFGQLTRIHGRAFVAGTLPLKIAERMASTARDALKRAFPDTPVEIESVVENRGVGSGTGIVVFAETSAGCLLSGSALSEKGVAAEQVAEKATGRLIGELRERRCVDEHMQDQVIVFMALAEGKSRLRCGPLSLHTRTAIHYAELMTGAKFNVREHSESDGGGVTITCDGIGFQAI
jgi:RNA 3'-terminal phosphate cyclase (ATP)